MEDNLKSKEDQKINNHINQEDSKSKDESINHKKEDEKIESNNENETEQKKIII